MRFARAKYVPPRRECSPRCVHTEWFLGMEMDYVNLCQICLRNLIIKRKALLSLHSKLSLNGTWNFRQNIIISIIIIITVSLTKYYSQTVTLEYNKLNLLSVVLPF